MTPLYLGIDIGTSGVRAFVIDADETIVASAHGPLPPPERRGGQVRQDAELWWGAVEDLLGELSDHIDMGRIVALAVDGTSGTILLADAAGRPLVAARLYNDQSAAEAGARIDRHAPADSVARGASSALARLLALLEEAGVAPVRHALHQADWVAGRLCGVYGHSDFNNCLKLGFDAVGGAWPGWLGELGFDLSILPEVAAPGDALGAIAPEMAQRFGFAPDCAVLRGTTDGNAAFLAAGDFELGVAVTSLGSTLTVKLVSQAAVFSPEFGVYSHRMLGHWLAGGASNTGGAAIARFFAAEQIAALSPALDPAQPTGLDYYPLPAPGERFPIADPTRPPVFEPRPESDAIFLQGILEGIAQIEGQAYGRLADLGATPVTRIVTVGGGAANEAWTAIRAKTLGVPVSTAAVTEAAFGSARLARLRCGNG